ncbi:hypothetical protein LOZ57_004212 [Ophidiomyces ophidiicola]|uniref:uncharacterized protein n=1 Tax=Ophidiomyces ophidiicola TaxID=1387563 RepID=UPI0020C59239|nr:uncharacterized protein LOZ57_004212 [Ophidiomyces ophidiicola]KAI1945525.1 hypothetical protein LOZ57_004212 [Ophidiomyces ophidiicola]KAI2063272.1 hypothetical protein LOZ43_000027 [Ophidiomyces ophidiicola]
MDPSLYITSSNVNAEYTDPSNLFPSIQPLLLQARQLRNLHWKSPTRPLRSIGCLQIDFVPAQSAEEQKRLSDSSGGAFPHRRHQIPGLCRTPYLKLYLLRCDDNETYKTASRKLLREWVKSLGSSSGGGSQDNHNAFEWLIIHVVDANTSTSEAPEKAGPMAKWPGRGSTSVFEKIKADFNGSSKSAVDRVVQLKIPKHDGNQQPLDVQTQLEDLVTKLKSSILTSFDLRVAQYEDDIREKDSQRGLPGWNFCTFFILKEGLALGFENVGLYEDALIGYDELSVGLEAALREQSSNVGDQHGMLLAYSDEMKSRVKTALSSINMAPTGAVAENSEMLETLKQSTKDAFSNPIQLDSKYFPFDTHKKPYRDMIVANNISAFDFRAYIFSRQMQLLLAAAQSHFSGDTLPRQGAPSQEYDLRLVGELCDRASEFISLASRILRNDVQNGVLKLDTSNDEIIAKVLNNLVYSWSYAAVSQVLLRTTVESLGIPRVSIKTNKDLLHASIVSSYSMRSGVPQRSSSLAASPTISSGFDFHSPSLAKLPTKGSFKILQTDVQKTGAAELASARGDLYFFARRILENIGRERGWGQQWNNIALLFNGNDPSTFTDISLDDQSTLAKDRIASPASLPILSGIDTPVLKLAIQSSDDFVSCYESLTDEIFRHYVAANRMKSAEAALADMAILKYRQGDYETAASYFQQLADFYNAGDWELLEGTMLELYGRCLEKLDRKEEFVHTYLKLLGKYARAIQASTSLRGKGVLGLGMDSLVPAYIRQLFDASHSLSKQFIVPLQDFFTIPTIDPRILHFEDKDGFQLQLCLRFLLAETITVESATVRLVTTVDNQTSELVLKSGPIVFNGLKTTVLLESLTTVQGKYFVDRIDLYIKNIVFSYNPNGGNTSPTTYKKLLVEEATDEDPRPAVICYQRAGGFDAKISHSCLIDLSGRRSIEVEFNSGSNAITHGVIRLKPATAGLRLLIAEAEVVNGSIELGENDNPGQIHFCKLGPSSSAVLSIPYTVEGSKASLIIRLEVEYETEKGDFLFLTSKSVLTTLPVSVNVQDVFKDTVLFSRFTISPAMMIPLRVFDCQMSEGQAFDIESGMEAGEIFDIFPKQPASLVYKIVPKESTVSTSKPGSRSLRLSIDFTCVNEECLTVLERQFSQDLDDSPFSQLRCLLLPHLLESFSLQWTAEILEQAGLLREIDVLPYERIQWPSITRTLGNDLERQVVLWLKAWHKRYQTLVLQDKPAAKAIRQIIIPVDIPEIQVVYTAKLVLHNIPVGQSHAAVGEAIHAELQLRHTRRWCPEERREAQSSLEFMYEIIANPDVWLVGGRRRGNFSADDGEMKVFPMILLPQRPGHLLLPHVEVKSFIAQESQLEPHAGAQRRVVPCEVDYRNHSTTILVTPNLRKITIGLDAAGTSGNNGAWVMESEKRVIPAD